MAKQVRMLVHTRLLNGELIRAGQIVDEGSLPQHLRRERFISYDLRPVLQEEEEPVARPFNPSKFGADETQRSIGKGGKRPSVAEQEAEFYAEQPDDSPLAGSFAADFAAVESAEEEADLGEGVVSSQRPAVNQFGQHPTPACKRARTRR
jgi:hypothetical protein